MENTERSFRRSLPDGFVLAPIDASRDGAPLRVCILTRLDPKISGSHIILRELPEACVYLGCLCDARAAIIEWVEIWVQSFEARDLAYSRFQERLSNFTCDERWRLEWENLSRTVPQRVIAIGMETTNPTPVIIKRPAASGNGGFAPTVAAAWNICQNDAQLTSAGLPAYSTSSFRYLCDAKANGPNGFLAIASDAPTNDQVKPIAQLASAAGALTVFNPQAGFIRVTRFSPLELEDYIQILEGKPWPGPAPGGLPAFPCGVYPELQSWSAAPKGLPFVLHGDGNQNDRLNEIFFLKLSALYGMFKEVRSYLQTAQLPLLNLSPASFRIELPETGDQFPVLWAAKCRLVKPGQAYPLAIKSTTQRYFVRLGKTEISPYLPESIGSSHASGTGSVRVRTVTTETDGIVLEGTLVAEEYLSLKPSDLLWFKLPAGDERIEFFARVFAAESTGPKEVRFRTIPARLPDSASALLKPAAGAVFPKSPYEVWPLVSSPCDLFSLGVMGVRLLLANHTSNFPVILDEFLGLARHFGNDAREDAVFLADFKSLLNHDQQLLDLVSPHKLIQAGGLPHQARARIHLEIWYEAIALLLRLFPGTGTQAYCKDLGDVSPLALENIFHPPIQKLEILLLRLRSVLAPSLADHEEISGVLMKKLAAL